MDFGKGKTIDQKMSGDLVHIWAFHGRTGIVYMCEKQQSKETTVSAITEAID